MYNQFEEENFVNTLVKIIFWDVLFCREQQSYYIYPCVALCFREITLNYTSKSNQKSLTKHAFDVKYYFAGY